MLRSSINTQIRKYSTNHPSLQGKAAFITGASRGIGFAIAQHFAREGVKCTLAGRDATTLEKARQQLAGDPADHRIVVGDVNSIHFWKLCKADGSDKGREGHYHQILVNAAGITQTSLLLKTDYLEIKDILHVNLLGTILACKHFAGELMRQQRQPAFHKTGGSIINISSLLAERGGYGASVYAASKAGILGLTRSLALELSSRGIRTNVIVPGYIKTDMTKDLNDDRLIGEIPLGRLGSADEVAEAAVFLAKNDYANNCVLNLDGGLSAK